MLCVLEPLPDVLEACRFRRSVKIIKHILDLDIGPALLLMSLHLNNLDFDRKPAMVDLEGGHALR